MVYRIYVEKKPGFDGEAQSLKNELVSLLGIKELTGLRLLNRYDVEGIDEALFNQCANTVFSEPPVDNTYAELPASDGVSFAVEYLPGQFDQRADSAAECMEKIFLPTIKAMNAEGCPFKGCLYFGLMLTPDGPKVIEYNCRFGDPETQVVLPLLEGDLLHIMQACTGGTLENEEVKFSDGAAACVILASGGYPVAYEKGKPITGLVDGQLPDEENVTVYHSGTALTEDGTLVTNGGRVLGVTATGPRLTNALSHAYEAAEKISFEKLHKRSDIGLRALKALAEKE